MTKEDYMMLPKEKLAELLEERDRNIIALPRTYNCWEPGGTCINRFHDCINCPKTQSTGGLY